METISGHCISLALDMGPTLFYYTHNRVHNKLEFTCGKYSEGFISGI